MADVGVVVTVAALPDDEGLPNVELWTPGLEAEVEAEAVVVKDKGT